MESLFFIVLSSIAVRLDILGCKQYLDVIFDDFATISESVSGFLSGFELILEVLFVRSCSDIAVSRRFCDDVIVSCEIVDMVGFCV